MIRNLHFYKWLVAVVVLICSTITMSAQNMETSVLNLKAGSVIKIYPRPNFNNNYYALACSGDGERLESYHDAGSGDEWTLEDAGNGYCYLKNDNGCYWSQVSSSSEVLKCTINKSSAVKILFTWDADYYGVRIWNEKNCLGLIARSQGNGYNHFKWDSNIYDKTSSAPIFSIAVLQEGRGDPFSGGENKEIILNRIKYKLHCNKTAEVVKNYYYGDIVIPETVKYNNFTYKITSIEDDCFKDCSSLTSISLPSGITSLGRYCFEFCSSLTSVSLPSGITSLEWYCFDGCSSLTSISLPSGITELKGGCFRDCSSLTSIYLPSGITELGASCFSGCSNLTSISLPSGITSLAGFCFQDCSSLTSVSLPSGITELGAYCFSGCSNLTSVSLPSGITSLGYGCFEGCSSLASVSLPSGITSLGYRCFWDCSSLTSIELPSGITSLGESCFLECI